MVPAACSESRRSISAPIFSGAGTKVPDLPDLAVFDRVNKGFAVILRQRLEPRMRSFERDRLQPGHGVLRSFTAICAIETKFAKAICLTSHLDNGIRTDVSGWNDVGDNA
jgi:hypothetical protein